MGNKYLDALQAGQSVNAEAGGNPYLNALQDEADRELSAFRGSATLAVGSNPDQVAKQKRIAEAIGKPLAAVHALPDESERLAKIKRLEQATENAPALRKAFTDADFAKLAHDDAENLSAIERSFLGNITEPWQRGLAQGRRGLTLLFDQMGIFKGLDRQRAAAAAAHGISYDPSIELAVRLAQQQREVERYPVPDDIAQGMQDISNAQTMGDAFTAIRTNPRAVLETTLQSLGASAPALVGAAGGSVFGPGGTATGAGLGSFAVEYSNTLQDVMAEKGVNGTDPMSIHAALNSPELMAAAREKALKRGIPVANFDALTAGLAGKLLAGAKPTVGSVGARAAGELGLQAGGGAAGEAGAQLATGEYKPGDILMEAFAEMPTAIIEVPGNYRHAMESAQRAQKGAEFIDNLNKLVQADKLVARDPQTFEQFVAQAAEAGPVQQVFIDAQTLMQSGVAQQVAAVSPAVASQLATAAQTGGQIAIPVEEYAARIAPTEYAQSLLDHLKTDPEGFSRAEAQQYMQSPDNDLRKELERVLSEKANDDSFKALQGQILEDLNKLGRFTPDKNNVDAAVLSAYFFTRADQLGTTPEQEYKESGLNFSAESMASKFHLDQGAIEQSVFGETLYHGTNSEGFEGIQKDGVINGPVFLTPRKEAADEYGGDPEKTIKVKIPRELLKVDFDLPGQKLLSVEDANVYSGNEGWDISDYLANGYSVGVDASVVINPDAYRARSEQLNQSPLPDTIDVDGVTRPTTNSKGNPIHPTEEGIRNFWRWFGSSRVVDDQGRPLAVYHGTNADFSEFDPEAQGSSGQGSGEPGFFFEASPDNAGRYTRQGGGANVMPVYLSLKNPLVVERTNGKYDYDGSYSRVAFANFIDDALEIGHDGVIFRDVLDRGKRSTQYVAFSPEQIKSATGNRGTFDPNDPNILNQAARGAFDPSRVTISLLQGADLSTFLHESAHFFLENDIRLAGKLIAKPESDLTAGERRLLNDVSTLMKWFGIQGPLNEQIAQWAGMPFEEKRSYHEQLAESFERYLFSGEAPSVELQPYFQRIRAWMKSVYTSIKNFLAGNPRAGALNPEVRAVFDRMFATDEQIALAEQNRSMMRMFDVPDIAGMTPEEFADYHRDDKAATAAAAETLQARALRDMQWRRNAQAREIKRLQKEAREKRAEVEREVRREVMSQPIYRAWQFLTRKLTEEDKIGPPIRRTSSPEVLDETQDSLFAAIAKLGGLKREQVESEWGIDPKERISMPAFGKHVLRQNGGLSIDAMAEALAEYGYLSLDEHGKHDVTEFSERFFDELRGATQYSIAYDYAIDNARAGDQVVNPDALEAGRLDLDELKVMGLPDEVINAVRARRMTSKNGLNADLVASMFGFQSGDDLVRALAAVESPKDAIDALTDARMLERFGDLTSQEAIEQAADRAIHNELRARVLATEANALSKATGQRKILVSAAKEVARNVVSNVKVRHLSPSQYASAEARAGRAAEKAKDSGDIAKAAAEKRNQLFNFFATQYAYDAQDEIERGLRYVNQRVTSATSQKAMRGEAKAQLLALLDRFDLRKSITPAELDRQQSLADWATAEAERLAAPPPILSAAAADESVRTHYKNLTVEEFRGLIDSIRQLERLARREHEAYIAIRGMNLQQEVEAGVAEIRAAWPKAFDADGKPLKDTPLTHHYAPSLAKSVSKGLQHMNAEFVPLEELVDQLTAGKFGTLHDSLFGRISDASDRKAIMAGEIRARLAPALNAYSFTEKRAFSRQVVGETRMTRENLLMLLLYYGNVEGRQRLASQGFNDATIQNYLAHLTDKDMDLAEAIWSLNDDYIWPMYSALNERTQGKAPPKVQAIPVAINGRDLRGGYVKLVYDAEFDELTRHRDSLEDVMAMLGGRANQTAKTNQGSSIERIDELSKMPLLELRAVRQAVNEHMHDIAYREAVADTVRVLRDPTLRDAIKAVLGAPVYTEMLAKLNEVAAMPRDPSGVVLKALDIARKNTIVVLMSGVKTALINYAGLLPALTRVNAGALIKNIAKVHSWRMREMIEFAKENSTYMRGRNQQFIPDLRHEMASLTVENRILPEMGTFLILMRMVDQLTSTTLWITAYEDGNKRFRDHDRAVEYANNVTRSTQGSGRDVDTSKIMTRFGPWSRPFLMFYSFFNRQLALLVRQGVISRNQWQQGNRAKAVGTFAAAYIAIVVVPALIDSLAGGKCDDAMDGDEGWTRCIAKSITMFSSSFIPVLRDVAPYAWARLDDAEPNWGLRTTALSSYFEGVVKGASSTVDVINDEGDERDTKAIFMGLAFTFGVPGKLMWDVAAGTEAVINDDAPLKSVLFGPPKN